MQHLQGSEVELLIPSQCCCQLALRFRKCRRIQNDAVVLLSRVRVVAEQIKRVRLDPLDIAAVQVRIVLGCLQCWTGTVHASDLVATSSQMQRKATLVTEDVQCLAACVLRSSRIIFPLIKERSGFLPSERVVDETHAVHDKFSSHRFWSEGWLAA